MQNISEWLEKLKLGEHAEAFIENDVDLEALPHLTEAMLKEMGLSIGVRAKLIAGLRLLATKRDQNPPKKHGNIPL